MATQKQILANRSNAQLSTGPRTEQGKAISRMNALKSGIDAINEAASGENPAVLAALTAEYDREFYPIGVVERFLVDILVKDDWFLRRYRFFAADLVNHTSSVAFESKMGADFGAGFANNTNSFQRLHRQIVETERSYFTHLAELERRQTLRRQHQPDVDSSVTDSSETENPEIGFVSQPNPASPDAHQRPSFGFVPHAAPPAPKTVGRVGDPPSEPVSALTPGRQRITRQDTPALRRVPQNGSAPGSAPVAIGLTW